MEWAQEISGFCSGMRRKTKCPQKFSCVRAEKNITQYAAHPFAAILWKTEKVRFTEGKMTSNLKAG
jgi:hypothetical protein